MLLTLIYTFSILTSSWFFICYSHEYNEHKNMNTQLHKYSIQKTDSNLTVNSCLFTKCSVQYLFVGGLDRREVSDNKNSNDMKIQKHTHACTCMHKLKVELTDSLRIVAQVEVFQSLCFRYLHLMREWLWFTTSCPLQLNRVYRNISTTLKLNNIYSGNLRIV